MQNVTKKADKTSMLVAQPIMRLRICVPPISDPMSQHCDATPSLQTPLRRMTLAMTVFVASVERLLLEPSAPIKAANMTAKAAPMIQSIRRPIRSVTPVAIKQPLRPATAIRILYWKDWDPSPIDVKNLTSQRQLPLSDSRWTVRVGELLTCRLLEEEDEGNDLKHSLVPTPHSSRSRCSRWFA